MIYFDSAATTFQKPECVYHAVSSAMRTMSSPGRGGYDSAMKAADCVLDCRLALAEMFHVAEPEQVIFTHNATEALNIAIMDLAKPGERVLVSGFEHNAVTRPLYAIGAKIETFGFKLFDNDTLLREFRAKIGKAGLVVCTHVSNAFGYILPIVDIADICRENHVPLIVDASQSAGVLPLDFQKLDAAFAAMPGHKGLFGPQGTGVLLCRDTPKPLLFGGTGSDSKNPNMPDYLPDRLEAGTHNVAGIAGLLAGCRWVMDQGSENILRHEQKLMRLFLRNIDSHPKIECFAAQNVSDQSGVLSLRLRNMDAEACAEKLSDRGVAVRAGLHCAPFAHTSAGTINEGTVRFSFSPFNTTGEVLEAAQILMDFAG